MIARSRDFDLGKDKTRMKYPDAARQEATVSEILKRFFTSDDRNRSEIQILADEVGMGKTFVALGVAYSILAAMRDGHWHNDLRRCYKRVLIVTPQNDALYKKWKREVGEFVKRCVGERDAERHWFRPVCAERIDELASILRRSGNPNIEDASSHIIVTKMNLFAGSRLVNYDLKRRFLLGALFRFWGTRFRVEDRERLLKGAPGGWPNDPSQLTALTKEQWWDVPFYENEICGALGAIAQKRKRDGDIPDLEALREDCLDIAAPYARGRQELFSRVEQKLTELYKAVSAELILQAFPLVIVDEAHHWKNGPARGSNGFRDFERIIARRARRALLLTATPFQLRPSEMLEILKVSEHLAVAPSDRESEERCARLRKYRDGTLKPALDRSDESSHRLAKAWSGLPRTTNMKSQHIRKKTEQIGDLWYLPQLVQARKQVRILAEKHGALDEDSLSSIVDASVSRLDPDFRGFLREALKLYAYNANLSRKLGRLIIRHRRRTDHRVFRVGGEFNLPLDRLEARPDCHLLHSASGLNVLDDAELPHYLLMRCVSEMKKAQGRRGRSSIGSALTGCYSTLLHSAEGKKVEKHLVQVPDGKLYLDMLRKTVNRRHDCKHPKMQAVVDTLLDNWRHGEKTLIFCFRINTAERLQAIAEKRIKAELLHRRSQCLGGKKQLVALRKRVTGRNSDLVPIVTDRVLWSRLWFAAERGDASVAPEDFTLTRGDVDALAELSLRCRVPLTSDKVDRVWLTRATEHVIARRLLERDTVSPEWRHLLRCLAQESWILHPYGLADEDKNGREGENVGLDQRGMNALYKIAGSTSQEDVSSLARRLMDIRLNAKRAGQTPVLDAYASGPNLWTGESPGKAFSNKCAKKKAELSSIHRHLWSLRRVEDGGFDWHLRRRIFEALRRAFLREPVLLRLLPSKVALAESSWGKMLVQAFLDPLPNQSESMADHIAVFLEDLIAASDETRDSMLEATKLRNQQIVALVKGKGGGKANIQRDRVFTGFNTPLLPEVLVCTSIGQEGIDLHRHCRHVIHYDLAWNPAVLEQRTGRVDRIGSKTFRERDLATTEPKPRLEIGVPFLAGTYDERMFEELRLRAQTFEVLTGGELVADNPEGSDEVGEGSESNLHFIPLPESMVSDMRVNLHVWNPSPASRPGPPKRIGARVHALLPVRDPGVVRGGPHE